MKLSFISQYFFSIIITSSKIISLFTSHAKSKSKSKSVENLSKLYNKNSTVPHLKTKVDLSKSFFEISSKIDIRIYLCF
ncbi:MAG: hypothetical protein Q8S84_00725 [bacterium]|nr:hypothetical protein [bacterium]MDP3380106.1 hypothetical protein [bacterium]